MRPNTTYGPSSLQARQDWWQNIKITQRSVSYPKRKNRACLISYGKDDLETVEEKTHLEHVSKMDLKNEGAKIYEKWNRDFSFFGRESDPGIDSGGGV